MRFFICLFLFVSCTSFTSNPTNGNQLPQNQMADTLKSIDSLTEATTNQPKADQTIDPRNFNPSLLEALILNGINEVRQKKRLSVLYADSILYHAAADQNTFVAQKGALTHEQPNKSHQTVRKRVNQQGGDYEVIGENIAYQGFTTITEGRRKFVEYNTYAEMAKQMVKLWVKSPPHYENVIFKKFDRSGVHVLLDNKRHGIYATQVFSTKQ
ncbi:MAG: CAP domain-containing protein [Sphingobacteriales bacterium]|jgi:uncharacterized protein YkwD|nr:CAP domain-containing protein [Sphingobacteriales bacterium]MBP9140114.1 CAP domain-containing protein [Chitinophagales bacterium]MDA0198228.1 CAP domain-containing protein [Bacteroidota bacterium]MBK6889975.1 CAP domain-containing protein [Sphingobacteriales bacterium]MBK7527501.1 CAP domain-containing protein [Sphingobacteriales bacterium]